MANNGFKGWTILEEYDLATNAATGNTKANQPGQADYIPPVSDPTSCPINVRTIRAYIGSTYTPNPYPAVGGTLVVSASLVNDDDGTPTTAATNITVNYTWKFYSTGGSVVISSGTDSITISAGNSAGPNKSHSYGSATMYGTAVKDSVSPTTSGGRPVI